MFRAFIATASRNAAIYFHQFVDKRPNGIFCYISLFSAIKHQAPASSSAKAGLVYCSGCDTSVVGLRVKCSRTRHLLVTAPRSVADLPLWRLRHIDVGNSTATSHQLSPPIENPKRNKKKKKKINTLFIGKMVRIRQWIGSFISGSFQNPPRIIKTPESHHLPNTSRAPSSPYIIYYTIIIDVTFYYSSRWNRSTCMACTICKDKERDRIRSWLTFYDIGIEYYPPGARRIYR